MRFYALQHRLTGDWGVWDGAKQTWQCIPLLDRPEIVARIVAAALNDLERDA